MYIYISYVYIHKPSLTRIVLCVSAHVCLYLYVCVCVCLCVCVCVLALVADFIHIYTHILIRICNVERNVYLCKKRLTLYDVERQVYLCQKRLTCTLKHVHINNDSLSRSRCRFHIYTYIYLQIHI